MRPLGIERGSHAEVPRAVGTPGAELSQELSGSLQAEARGKRFQKVLTESSKPLAQPMDPNRTGGTSVCPSLMHPSTVGIPMLWAPAYGFNPLDSSPVNPSSVHPSLLGPSHMDHTLVDYCLSSL